MQRNIKYIGNFVCCDKEGKLETNNFILKNESIQIIFSNKDLDVEDSYQNFETLALKQLDEVYKSIIENIYYRINKLNTYYLSKFRLRIIKQRYNEALMLFAENVDLFNSHYNKQIPYFETSITLSIRKDNFPLLSMVNYFKYKDEYLNLYKVLNKYNGKAEQFILQDKDQI